MSTETMARPREQAEPWMPLVRPGWVCLQLGHWVRAAAVVAVDARELPEPELADGIHMVSSVWVGGHEFGSGYPTDQLLDALEAAEGDDRDD